jgi:hypothetical protein
VDVSTVMWDGFLWWSRSVRRPGLAPGSSPVRVGRAPRAIRLSHERARGPHDIASTEHATRRRAQSSTSGAPRRVVCWPRLPGTLHARTGPDHARPDSGATWGHARASGGCPRDRSTPRCRLLVAPERCPSIRGCHSRERPGDPRAVRSPRDAQRATVRTTPDMSLVARRAAVGERRDSASTRSMTS